MLKYLASHGIKLKIKNQVQPEIITFKHKNNVINTRTIARAHTHTLINKHSQTHTHKHTHVHI